MQSTAHANAGDSSPGPHGLCAVSSSPKLQVIRHPQEDGTGFKTSALLHMFLDTLRVGIVLCNSAGRITLVNQEARQLAQKDPEGEMLSTAPSIWGEMFDVNGRDVPVAEWPWVRALHGLATSCSEYRLVRRKGDYRDVLFGAYPIPGRQSQTAGVLSSLTNITDHKRREVVLREDAVLNERSRMAGEIHDTVVQGLNAVVLQLEVADKELGENFEQGRQRLRRLRKIASENLAEARRSIWALSRESFGNEDPAVALAFLARRLFEGIAIELRLHMEKSARRLAPEVRLELLRIGKEAMANVLRHARATVVRIELAYSDGQVRLAILDNGRGFTVLPLSNAPKGFGLFALRTRAENIGGRLMVHSKLGRGTRIVATIPL
jgi:signal transduction histidine kinase